MFLPSFFTGHLIARFGVLRDHRRRRPDRARLRHRQPRRRRLRQFPASPTCWSGIGWNFAFVGGSTLLTTTYAPGRARQGAGQPRLHGLRVPPPRPRAALGRAGRQGRLGRDQPGRRAADVCRQRTPRSGSWPSSGGLSPAAAIARWPPWAIATTGTRKRRPASGAARPAKPPSEIIGWGLSAPARIGHNQGPPLDEPAADAFVALALAQGATPRPGRTPPHVDPEIAHATGRSRRRQLSRVHARALGFGAAPASRRRRQAAPPRGHRAGDAQPRSSTSSGRRRRR